MSDEWLSLWLGGWKGFSQEHVLHKKAMLTTLTSPECQCLCD